MFDLMVSPGKRTATLANEDPAKTALVYVTPDGDETDVTWGEIEDRSNQVARVLADAGANADSMVIIHIGNSPELMISAIAAWKLGACVLPLSPRMPTNERDEVVRVVQTVRPAIAIADWERQENPADIPLIPTDLRLADDRSTEPLDEDLVPQRGKAICSGGSTGRPKIIYDTSAYQVFPIEAFDELPDNIKEMAGPMLKMPGMEPGMTNLVALPMYHSGGWGQAFGGLFNRHTLVLMARFDAELAVSLIERHGVNYTVLVPTMMQRVARLENVRERDFSSLTGLLHGGSPIPEWVKRTWLELMEPSGLLEAYSGTEAFGGTMIRGDEWLEHPGSVGKPMPGCDVKILDDDMNEVPQGEIGEIFFGWAMRPASAEYVGSPEAKRTEDGFTSFGDLGWLDDDGYLHLADRRFDMIITGGSNVFPAEVESALTEHPEVVDVAVIGLPDEEWGKSVHAVVQPRDINDAPSIEQLQEHCRSRLTNYKVPKTIAFVEELPRDQTGKIRRSALIDDAVDQLGQPALAT